MNSLPQTQMDCELRVGAVLRKWLEEGKIDCESARRILKDKVSESTFSSIYEFVFNSKDVNHAITER